MATSESKGPSRAYRLRNDLTLLIMILQRPGPPFGLILRNWRSLRGLPEADLSMYAATCKICAFPHVNHHRYTDDGFSLPLDNTLKVIDLQSQCITCRIILQTYKLVHKKPPEEQTRVRLGYNRKAGFLRLRFTSSAAGSTWLEQNGHIGDVQIFRKETFNRLNPLPLLKYNISPDPLSATLIGEIKNWISNCESEHQICQDAVEVGGAFIPSRLLKFDDGVRLCVPQESVHFAALSYCWGASKQPVTTRANLQSRLGQVDVAELPQTLRDAIYVCRSLGFQYIWIDSLCIVQDDEDDWATQSSQMARLYFCASVVIAATLADDANEGFLRPRDLSVTLTTARSKRGAVCWGSRRVRNHHLEMVANTDIRALPLSKRGWALQEELLATRILYFCPDEVVYRCRTSVRCECQRDESEHTVALDTEDTLTMWPPPERRRLCYRFIPHDEDGFMFSVSWGKIAREFSSRRLTYPEDALPAVSGIAHYTTSHINLGDTLRACESMASYSSWAGSIMPLQDLLNSSLPDQHFLGLLPATLSGHLMARNGAACLMK